MKKKCPEFENHERWLVSYADMLTLLFAVFVVLFALKEGGEPQVQRAAGAMQESFNTPLEDIPIDRRIGPMEQGFGIFEHFRGDKAEPELILKHKSSRKEVSILNLDLEKLQIELEERLYGPEKHRETNATGQKRIVSVHKTRKGLKLQLLARNFYKDQEIQFDEQQKAVVDKIIETLLELNKPITIEGHTDSLEPDAMSNWDLSALRASYMVKYMIQKHSFPQAMLGAAGYADTKPIAHNGSVSGRKLNQRIEFHIHHD